MKILKKVLSLLMVLTLMFVGTVKNVSAAPTVTSVPKFKVITEVKDYGQTVTMVVLDMGAEVLKDSFDKTYFTVHAKHYIDSNVDFDNDKVITSAYVASDAKGTKAEKGNFIVLELEHGMGVAGSGTLFWDNPAFSNVPMTLEYKVKLIKDIGTGTPCDIEIAFDGITNLVVDDFAKKTSTSGLNYRVFSPTKDDHKNPLVIWLHGAGEGGNNNETQITGNRGGVAFAESDMQSKFGGAYVVAPQAPDFWMDEFTLGTLTLKGGGHTEKLISLIKEVISSNPDIDSTRVYIGGCSMGGYQTLKTIIAAPTLFAAAFPICPAYAPSKDELEKIVNLPVWLTHAATDDTVTVENSRNTYKLLKELGGKVVYTEYEDVRYAGNVYGPHSSWVYVLNNDPVNDDKQHIVEWIASQKIKVEEEKKPVPTADSTLTNIYLIALASALGSIVFLKRKNGEMI